MTSELQGGLQGEGLRIAVVVSRFNETITSRLLEGAKSALNDYGVREQDVVVTWVPGSFEIPLIAKKLAGANEWDAVVCLGAVIRGETDHYDHVASQTSAGVKDVSLDTGIPVTLGVLTTDTVELAEARAGGKQGNIGFNATVAAIEMANLIKSLDQL